MLEIERQKILEKVKAEGNGESWEHNGLVCVVRRNVAPGVIHWCGYVGLPEGHEYYGKDYDDIPVKVHGGLSYSNGILTGYENLGKFWWVGFDCAHWGDIAILDSNFYSSGDVYRDKEYVKGEANYLAQQLSEFQKNKEEK